MTSSTFQTSSPSGGNNNAGEQHTQPTTSNQIQLAITTKKDENTMSTTPKIPESPKNPKNTANTPKALCCFSPSKYRVTSASPLPRNLERELVLDRFEVVDTTAIGEGTFACVYKGVDLSSGTNVAIKRYKYSDAEAMQRFRREVHMLRILTCSGGGDGDRKKEKHFMTLYAASEIPITDSKKKAEGKADRVSSAALDVKKEKQDNHADVLELDLQANHNQDKTDETEALDKRETEVKAVDKIPSHRSVHSQYSQTNVLDVFGSERSRNSNNSPDQPLDKSLEHALLEKSEIEVDQFELPIVVTELADVTLRRYLLAHLRAVGFDANDGADLSRRRLPRLGPQVLRKVTQDLLRAVAFLHEKGFVHLDLKPENVVRVGRSGMETLVLNP